MKTVEESARLEEISEAALETPAVFSNLFNVMVNQENVRIAFGETIPNLDSIKFRSAIILSRKDTRSLLENLTKILDSHD